MPALQVIESEIWRDTLLNLEEPIGTFPIKVLTLFPGFTPAKYKVFWEHAEDVNAMPYITTHHISGGRLKDPSYTDTTWKIVGHTADMETARAMANAISLLANANVNSSSYPTVCAYDWIWEIMPVFDRYQTQNVAQFVAGGLYRLRLNLGDL